MKKRCILGNSKCTKWWFWSDCVSAQADLNFRWAHKSIDTFSDVAAYEESKENAIHKAATVKVTSKARALRKHAYSNILKISSPKTENFPIITSDIFHISAQNVDCGYSLEPPRRGGSNEYPQPMFLNRNKKNNVYPCIPQFYYIKVGFKGVKII